MATFKVNGREYPVPEEFTLGEMCDMEQHFGVRFGQGEQFGLRMTAATLYVAIRRVDPTVTVDDIRDLPTDVLKELTEAAEVGPELPPDEPNGLSGTSGAHLSAA